MTVAMMEKMVQQMAQGAGWFRLERGRGIRMDELCNLPEAIRGELESVSSSRMLLPSSSEPRPGVSWSEMMVVSRVFSSQEEEEKFMDCLFLVSISGDGGTFNTESSLIDQVEGRN